MPDGLPGALPGNTTKPLRDPSRKGGFFHERFSVIKTSPPHPDDRNIRSERAFNNTAPGIGRRRTGSGLCRSRLFDGHDVVSLEAFLPLANRKFNELSFL